MNINNTLIYTHLANFGSEEYVCKVAENVEEAKALIESGYEYITEMDGIKLFRKRKQGSVSSQGYLEDAKYNFSVNNRLKEKEK